MAEEKTKIELSHEDAQLFMEFQKRYIFMKFLQDIGMFTMKNGYLTIHFTNLGEVGSYDLVERFKHFKLPMPI